METPVTSRDPAPPVFRDLPKVELHCHIEGTMRPATVEDLAIGNGIEMPTDDVTELYEYDDLTGFLEIFWLVQSTLVAPEDWERLAYESIIDGAAHGLVYRETFFTPARHLVAGQGLGEIVAALDRGLDAAERDTGVRCRLIFDIDRDFDPAVSLGHVTDLVELRRTGAPGAERVIGMGMDSTEIGKDPMSFAESYALAGEAGLRRTAHQGENAPAWTIAAALDGLGCDRIDHGISVFEDPELVRRVVDDQVPLTVCPNANVLINPDVFARLEDHVFPRMREAGILATLNTDDPAMVGLDLTQEYERCAEVFGYSPADMVDIALDGVRGSWLDESDAAVVASSISDAAANMASAPSST
ncbi:MAG: adenosine deaminase [Actinomycetota bacterium]